MSGPAKTAESSDWWKTYQGVFRCRSHGEGLHRLLEQTGLADAGWYDPGKVMKKLQHRDVRLLTNHEVAVLRDDDVPARLVWAGTLYFQKVFFVHKQDGRIVTRTTVNPNITEPSTEMLQDFIRCIMEQPRVISPVVSLELPMQQPGLSGPRYQRLRGAQFLANLMLCNPTALVTMGSDPEGNAYHSVESVYDEPDRDGKLPVITMMPGYPFDLDRYTSP